MPEADREVHTERLYYKKKLAISAIPVIDKEDEAIEISGNQQTPVLGLNCFPDIAYQQSASKMLVSLNVGT